MAQYRGNAENNPNRVQYDSRIWLLYGIKDHAKIVISTDKNEIHVQVKNGHSIVFR